LDYNVVLPEAQLATGNTGRNVVEKVVTDGAPCSVVFDLQTTFTLCRTVDESQTPHIYNNKCDLSGVNMQQLCSRMSVQYENVDVLAVKLIYT